jgi:hypothetical protein
LWSLKEVDLIEVGSKIMAEESRGEGGMKKGRRKKERNDSLMGSKLQLQGEVSSGVLLYSRVTKIISKNLGERILNVFTIPQINDKCLGSSLSLL